jgi:3-methylfumaryl-CoA hydratase
MFGASRIAIAEPLRIGESVSINREVIGIEEKHGRTGDLVIVTIRNSATRGSTAVAYVEIQQIVFRDSSDFQRRADTYEPEEEGPGRGLYRHTAWEWRLHCDPVVLMRFSSATANTHRIHYDHAYATHVEGYPELVVQGPLLALCMAEILRLELPRYRVREFAFRAVYPAFSGQTVRFVGKRADASDGVQVNLTALVGDSPCMTGQAVLAHA